METNTSETLLANQQTHLVSYRTRRDPALKYKVLARETTQSIKCYHENLSLRTQLKIWAQWYRIVIPVWGRQREEDPWHSPAGQPSQISEPWPSQQVAG